MTIALDKDLAQVSIADLTGVTGGNIFDSIGYAVSKAAKAVGKAFGAAFGFAGLAVIAAI